MKNQLYTLLAVCLLAVMAGCSKKNMSASNDDLNKTYSRQLEMDYPVAEASVTTSSTYETVTYAVPLPVSGYALAVAAEKNERALTRKPEVKAVEKKSIARRFVEKMALKRVEKILKKQNTQDGGSGGNIITGIIVGIIGLVLIGIAGSTGAAGLVYLGGVVLFVAGIVLILIGIF